MHTYKIRDLRKSLVGSFKNYGVHQCFLYQDFSGSERIACGLLTHFRLDSQRLGCSYSRGMNVAVFPALKLSIPLDNCSWAASIPWAYWTLPVSCIWLLPLDCVRLSANFGLHLLLPHSFIWNVTAMEASPGGKFSSTGDSSMLSTGSGTLIIIMFEEEIVRNSEKEKKLTSSTGPSDASCSSSLLGDGDHEAGGLGCG